MKIVIMRLLMVCIFLIADVPGAQAEVHVPGDVKQIEDAVKEVSLDQISIKEMLAMPVPVKESVGIEQDEDNAKEVVLDESKIEKISVVSVPVQEPASIELGKKDLEKVSFDRPRSEIEKKSARIKRREQKEAQRIAEKKEQEERAKLLDSEYKSGKYAYLYKVPTWPLQVLVHHKPDLIDVRFQYQEAVQSYGSRGKKQNISGLIFGEDQITVKDLILALKLLNNDFVTASVTIPATTPANPNPLEFLQDEQVVFNGWYSDIRFNLGYSRNLHDDDFTFGFNLPIVRRENNLRMSVHLSDAGKTNVMNAKTLQLAKFGGTAEGFVLDALNYKGITFNGNEVASGLGDLTFFGNFQIHSRKCERIMLGGSFTFPTAQNRDTTKLWAPELGNGGFYAASLHGSLLGVKQKYFNPHVFAQATYYFPTPVTRRVPHFISKVAGTALSTNPPLFQYQGNISVPALASSFSQLDSTVRGFADTAFKVNIQKGFEGNIEVGNIFEQFLFRQGYLDLFYQFKVKGADKLGSAVAEDIYDTTVLFKNTAEFAHTLGFEQTYQFDRNVRVKLGGRYTIAGNNVPEIFEITAVLSTEF